MWVFLNDAMLSIVKHRGHDGEVLVRARIKGDIERVFPEAKVTRTPNADYLYRAVLTQQEVACQMHHEVNRIDYCNFKASISRTEAERYKAYSWVWDEMLQLQGRLEPQVPKATKRVVKAVKPAKAVRS